VRSQREQGEITLGRKIKKLVFTGGTFSQAKPSFPVGPSELKPIVETHSRVCKALCGVAEH